MSESEAIKSNLLKSVSFKGKRNKVNTAMIEHPTYINLSFSAVNLIILFNWGCKKVTPELLRVDDWFDIQISMLGSIRNVSK